MSACTESSNPLRAPATNDGRQGLASAHRGPAIFARWPIRNKLLFGVTLLLALVGLLSGSTLYGCYAYRGLVKSLSQLNELRLVNDLVRRVNDLRLAACELGRLRPEQSWFPLADDKRPPDKFELLQQLGELHDVLSRYREQLELNEETELRIGGGERELALVQAIDTSLRRIEHLSRQLDVFENTRASALRSEAESLQAMVGELPANLRRNILDSSEQVQGVYRTFLGLAYASLVLTVVTLVLLVRLVYRSVFCPLRMLAEESRKIAAGRFEHRIRLESGDELAELAAAMNDTTARFLAVCDHLDRQVQERTRQIVQSERLASAGFLAAGVSHEINNPLASIAMSAESLERRMIGTPLAAMEEDMRSYLRMIATEAQRCQIITAKLLDFSGLGETRREPVRLAGVVQEVAQVVGHVGKYRGKRVEVELQADVVAAVNPHEIKQVVLNLVTNALESISADGLVEVRLRRRGAQAEIVVRDNGCGMTEDVLQHLFEPFFTRRPSGQGTGLGLAITHRIVADHGGQIEAFSEGAGRGAEFRVRLPLQTEAPAAARQAA
jgi:signal transduction histidine kinase